MRECDGTAVSVGSANYPRTSRRRRRSVAIRRALCWALASSMVFVVACGGDEEAAQSVAADMRARGCEADNGGHADRGHPCDSGMDANGGAGAVASDEGTSNDGQSSVNVPDSSSADAASSDTDVVDDEPITVTPNTDTQPLPGCSSPQTCPDGTVRACIDLCVRPIGRGVACTPEACSATGTCAPGLACQRSPCPLTMPNCRARTSCLPIAQDGSCDLGDPNHAGLCGSGLFCGQRLQCCFNDVRHAHCRPQDLGCHIVGRCIAPQLEGQTCDSNFDDVVLRDQTGAAPCEPGTFCDFGICRRPCTRGSPGATGCDTVFEGGHDNRCSGDCPCGDFRCVSDLLSPTRAMCAQCTHDGASGCSVANNVTCCDPLAGCHNNGACCRDNGVACDPTAADSSAVCCGGMCLHTESQGLRVGTCVTAQTVTPTTPSLVSTFGSETAITFVHSTPSSAATLVVGFNTIGNTGGNVADTWAWSTTGTAGSWTVCNAIGTGSCGIMGTAPSTTAYPFAQKSAARGGWAGDPNVMAGIPGTGQVVYVSIGQSVNPAAKQDLIVASLSSDSGRTFPNSVMVNEHLAPDVEDQASLDVDPSNGEVAISWRHHSGFPDEFHAGVRTGRLISSTIDWFDFGHPVPDNVPPGAMSGISGAIVRWGPAVPSLPGRPHSTLAVVFGTPEFGLNSCPGPNGIQSWNFVSSTDGGISWGKITEIATDPNFPLCEVSNLQMNGFRNFGFVFNQHNQLYFVAVQTDRNTLSILASADGTDWFVADVITAPGSLFFPSLAVDNLGRVALTYYEGTSGDTQVRVAMVASPFDGAFGTWSSPVSLNSLNFAPGGAGIRSLGDYMGSTMALPDVNSAFTQNAYAAWTDLSAVSTRQDILVGGAVVSP